MDRQVENIGVRIYQVQLKNWTQDMKYKKKLNFILFLKVLYLF